MMNVKDRSNYEHSTDYKAQDNDRTYLERTDIAHLDFAIGYLDTLTNDQKHTAAAYLMGRLDAGNGHGKSDE